jgi:hypothetical protein
MFTASMAWSNKSSSGGSSSNNNVTVHVTVAGNEGDTATLMLHVCDRRLMGAPATLVSKVDVKVEDNSGSATVVRLPEVETSWQVVVSNDRTVHVYVP